MRIGAAATAIGVPSHVLRHWEDVGVLVPDRNGGGHRTYDDELLARARLVLLCQRAGLSLAEIRRMLAGDQRRRADLLAAQREQIAVRIAALQRTDGFLAHVLSCTHPVVTECPECAGFAEASSTGGSGRPGGF